MEGEAFRLNMNLILKILKHLILKHLTLKILILKHLILKD